MWVKKRHMLVRGFFGLFFKPILKAQYGYTYQSYPVEKGKSYLVLSNHQTKADQFMVSLLFNRPVYYIARDDLFSIRLLSPLLKWAIAPIPKNKVAKDTQTIRTSMSVVKEGGIVGLFPEGNLTFSGTTEFIDKATAKFVKLLKTDVLFVNLKGGYGARPRWANKPRKGGMTGAVVSKLTFEEFKDMSVEELYEYILKQLYVDDRKNTTVYKSKRKAEYLETCLYVCPNCGFAQFASKGNEVRCTSCQLTATCDEHYGLKGPFSSVKDWYDYQKRFMARYDILHEDKDKVLFCDAIKRFKQDIHLKRKLVLERKTTVMAYCDRLRIEMDEHSLEMTFDEISAMAILGRNKLEILFNNTIFYLLPTKRFNALKYVQLFYHYKNAIKGEDDSFLGL